MRIIAGESKNKIIKCKKGQETRPTMENVREALFSIIAAYVKDSAFLDLFSGSGAIALEALSRGASRAVMIEKDPEALKTIIENINFLGYDKKARAYKNDAERAIRILGRKNDKFDIVFMDPPYEMEICTKIVESIIENNIIKDDGIIICEHFFREKMPETILNYIKTDEREYSKKVITFYVIQRSEING